MTRSNRTTALGRRTRARHVQIPTPRHRVILAGAVAAAAALATGNFVAADLVHRYSFTGDGSDTVGGANGTVIDPSGAFHTFTGTQLDFSLNNGQSSNQNFANPATQGAYFDLPNGIISSLGTAASFETWVTVSTNRNWAEILSFGTSAGGEDV